MFFASAGVAILATVVFCATIVRAALPPRIYEGIPAELSAADEATDLQPGLSEEALQLVAERNPFVPGRGANPAAPIESIDSAARPVNNRLEVLGTAVLAENRGIAMISEGGGAARLVRVGQVFGAWTLQRVDPGRAHLRAEDGETLVISVTRKR
jgi:hypothetical protein